MTATGRKHNYADTYIDEITDPHLLGLFQEIFELRHEAKEGLVYDFLERSLHPFPFQTKKKKFEKHEFLMEYYLREKIGRLSETEIYKLCLDLVSMFRKGHIENYHGVALYIFLNRVIPENRKKKKGGSRSNK